MAIKTAKEVIANLPEARQKKIEKERAALKEQNRIERERLEFYEDLMDDVMSCVKNSTMTFQDIHARCGPHPNTLENWATHKVHKPQLGKMRAVLHILGLDFAIVSRAANGH